MSQPVSFQSPRAGAPRSAFSQARSPPGARPSFLLDEPETPPRGRAPAPLVLPNEDSGNADDEEERSGAQAPLMEGQDWSKQLTDTPLARARQRPDFQPLVSAEEREALRASLKEEHHQNHAHRHQQLQARLKLEEDLAQNVLPPPEQVNNNNQGGFQSPEVTLRMKTRPSRASSMGAGSPRIFRPIGLAQIHIPDEDQDSNNASSSSDERSGAQAPLMEGQDWSKPLTDTPLARARQRPDFRPLVSEDERLRLRRSIVDEDDAQQGPGLDVDDPEPLVLP